MTINNKIKVVQFITSMGEGGAQSLIKDYALYLNHEKFDVMVVCVFPMLDSGPGQLLVKNNIKVESIYPDTNLLWNLLDRFFGKMIVPFKLNKIFAEYKPDVLHTHLGAVKYLYSRVLKLPVNLLYTCHNGPKRIFRKQDVLRATRWLIHHRKMRLIALHNDMRIELDEMFGVDNTTVVYNGVDISRFNTVAESKQEIKRSLGISVDSFVVGHVGRFTEQKNHRFLIDVFSKIKEKKPNANLILVGTGPLKGEVEEKLKSLGLIDSCCFLSDRSDIDRVLKSFDVFVLPSLYEGLPVTLIEAQASGLKCIVSDSINEESFLLPTTVPISLEQSADAWADVILDESVRGTYCKDVKTFDMKSCITTLEKLYLCSKD